MEEDCRKDRRENTSGPSRVMSRPVPLYALPVRCVEVGAEMGGVSAEDNKVLPTGDARFHGAPADAPHSSLAHAPQAAAYRKSWQGRLERYARRKPFAPFFSSWLRVRLCCRRPSCCRPPSLTGKHQQQLALRAQHQQSGCLLRCHALLPRALPVDDTFRETAGEGAAHLQQRQPTCLDIQLVQQQQPHMNSSVPASAVA